MHNEAHPDTELLDRLRAGLLDDDTGMMARLERHIAACPQCRGRLHAWEHLGRQALGASPLAEDRLSTALKHARQRAMKAGQHRRIIRHPVLATAAVLLIAVSAGLWTLRHELVDTAPMTARVGKEVPDLYEDLDFYLWMANQGEGKMHEQGGNGNS